MAEHATWVAPRWRAVAPPTAEGLEFALVELLSDPAALAAHGGRLRDYVRARASC